MSKNLSKPIQQTRDRIFMMGILVLIAMSLFTACTFDGLPGIADGIQPEEVNAIWDSAALTRPYSEFRQIVYEDPGQIQVQHGASCARAKRALTEDNAGNDLLGIRVNERASMPAGYNTATVFLNGWRLHYSSDDHHILGLGTAIFDIEQDETELRWKAGGILSDAYGDDRYAWCYYYTIVMWYAHSFDLDAVPIDSDDRAELTFAFPYGHDRETTALRQLGASLSNEIDTPRALLPRGFGMMWDDDEDHHLLQLALKYGDSLTIEYEDGSASDIWWQFQTIFKDNNQRRNYFASELVSTLNGDSVRVIQPRFNISPQSKTSCPNLGSPSFREETFVVENVRFDYAIPMLTGWDIGDACEDHHVKELGAWIEDFNYEKAPGATTGTLTYTVKSIFRDKGGIFGSIGSKEPGYQVSILGLNAKGIILPRPPTPPVLNR